MWQRIAALLAHYSICVDLSMPLLMQGLDRFQ